MMSTDVFFDTNIIVYFASADPKSSRSAALLRAGGIVSVQVLNEFANVGWKKRKLPLPEVKTTLEAILSTCTVVPLTYETHVAGLALAERYQLSIYDAMILAAAKLAGCTTLFSEDMHHGLAIDGLRIVDPYRLK